MFKELIKFFLMVLGLSALCLMIYIFAIAPAEFTNYEIVVTVLFAAVVVFNYLGTSNLFKAKAKDKEIAEIEEAKSDEGQTTNF